MSERLVDSMLILVLMFLFAAIGGAVVIYAVRRWDQAREAMWIASAPAREAERVKHEFWQLVMREFADDDHR